MQLPPLSPSLSGISALIKPAVQSSPAVNGGSSATASPNSAIGDQSAQDYFMKYAAMSPMERMRENILQGMGISDDQLKAMSPDQQKAVEEKIKEQIEKETGANGNKSGQLIDV